jgi:small subunit ribosomal protein S16
VAVKIKLKRMGKIRAPYYRIVVADSRTKRDGRAIEEIGKYHPKADPSFIHVESERAQYWLSVGAQPTDPVRRILEITGDWQRFRGEPGAEGTLRTAAPKMTRSERFAEAVGTRPAGGETTPKGGGKAKKAETETGKQETAGKGTRRKTSAKADKADAQDKAEAKADKADAQDAKAEAQADKADAQDKGKAKADKADAQDKAEAKADKAEAQDAKTDAKADTEATVEAAASETETAESGSDG